MNDLDAILEDLLARMVIEDMPEQWKDARFLQQRMIQIDKRGSVGERFYLLTLTSLYPRRVEYRDGDQGDWDLKIGRMKFEVKTSSLDKRIEAINKLCDDNYKVGILIAPVIMVNNYKKLYKELIITLKNKLSEKVKKEVFFEVIFMTYSYVNNVINKEAFPNLINLYDKNIQTGRGKGKYVYKPSLKEEGKKYIEELLNVYFPNNIIKYIC